MGDVPMTLLCGNSLELLRGQCKAFFLSRSGRSVLQCKLVLYPGGRIGLFPMRGHLRLVNELRLRSLAVGRDMESAAVQLFGRTVDGALLKFQKTPDRLLEPLYEISSVYDGDLPFFQERLHFDGLWLRSFSAAAATGAGVSATVWKVQQWNTRSGVVMQPVSLSDDAGLPFDSQQIVLSESQGQGLCTATDSLGLFVLSPENGRSELWGHSSSHRVSV